MKVNDRNIRKRLETAQKSSKTLESSRSNSRKSINLRVQLFTKEILQCSYINVQIINVVLHQHYQYTKPESWNNGKIEKETGFATKPPRLYLYFFRANSLEENFILSKFSKIWFSTDCSFGKLIFLHVHSLCHSCGEVSFAKIASLT